MAATQTTLLSVRGMSCAGCVRAVEEALTGVPGVARATVNFADQSASVSGTAPVEALAKAVRKAGYGAGPLPDESPEARQRQARSTLVLAVAKSALALACGALLMADMGFAYLPALSAREVWLPVGLASLAVMLMAGGHFFRGAISALRHGATTMDTLIALGTGAAWCYSMLVVLLPAALPEQSRHQFFETALFVIGFVNLGKALEIYARSRASLAIRKLFDLTPRFATLLEDGAEHRIPAGELAVGQHLRIKPGENFPVDGEVVSGESSVNEALLTGESQPLLKRRASAVSAGTTNIDGSLVVRATGVGAQTRLAAITRLVARAQNSKPKLARLVDRVTAVFVPVVLLVALLTGALWLAFGPAPALSGALTATMSVLIIACPCALGLAVPMSVMVGLGRGAARGLLIRNSEVLQAAAGVNVCVLDKTGTLTLGEPEVVRVRGLSDAHLGYVYGLEQRSEHPIATAVLRYCRGRVQPETAISAFRSHAGGGVTARIEAPGGPPVEVVAGSRRFLGERGLTGLPEPEEAGAVVYVGVDNECVGYLVLEDELRAESPGVIASLKRAGIRPVMLTGDRREVARAVAARVGIGEVHAGLLPADKFALIQKLQSQGNTVAMVGDGINDAAALGVADVGIALGMGADVAMETADVTLAAGSLAGVEGLFTLSRRVLRNMRRNLMAAFAYNLLLIPVAAGALYPLTGLLLDPALAGLAMALSSVTVVFNAGRLRF